MNDTKIVDSAQMEAARTKRRRFDVAIIPAADLGRAVNRALTYDEVLDRYRPENIHRDAVTTEEYHKLPKPGQLRVKRAAGGIVFAKASGDRRHAADLDEYCMVALDFDDVTREQAAQLQAHPFLNGIVHFWHTTRSHTPEKPRWRLVIVTRKPLDPDKQVALSRITAHELDPTMRLACPASFKLGQPMFFPAAGPDTEYQFIDSGREGRTPLDGEALLEARWNGDLATLPRAPGEDTPREAGKKAADPTQKKGIVGAFCRSYDVEAAMEAFIPGVYVPGSEPGRWTYAKGSSANGAQVLDGGKALRSYHATDSCGTGKPVNAWDMVRRHLFGHLDAAGADGEVPDGKDAPSFKAMAELAGDDDTVREQLDADKYDNEALANTFDGDDEESESTSEAGWRKSLVRDTHGNIKPGYDALYRIIQNDQRLKGKLQYNRFKEQPVLTGEVLSPKQDIDLGRQRDPIQGEPLTDYHVACIRHIIEAPRKDQVEGQTGYGMPASERDLRDAILKVTWAASFSPPQEWLQSLAWDSNPRLDTMFLDYWHGDPTKLNKEAGALLMLAMCRRIIQPGTKFDYVPIFGGEQGIGKSLSLAVLAGPLGFVELTADFGDTNKFVENILGHILAEIPELSQFKNKTGRNSIESIKGRITAAGDRCRLAWDRKARTYPRQTVLVGTTNKRAYLYDETGNRRILPVPLFGKPKVKIAALKADVRQLWAEAWERAKVWPADKPLVLSDDAESEAKRLQDAATVYNPVTDDVELVRAWLDEPVPAWLAELGAKLDPDLDDLAEEPHPKDGPPVVRDKTCVADVIAWCFPDNQRTPTMPELHRLRRAVGEILRERLGWTPEDHEPYVDGVRTRVFRRPAR